MGLPGTVSAAMDASALAQTIPIATHTYILCASHCSFMNEYPLLGRLIVGLPSLDSICARSPSRRALHTTIAPEIIGFLTTPATPLTATKKGAPTRTPSIHTIRVILRQLQ